MAEKVKRLMVTLDKAKQGANKALSDFEAELKSLQCEVDVLEETTTGLRTKLVLTQAQLSLTKEEVQRRQEREEKLQAELMTAKTEMAVMQNTQKDLEGQLAAASSSCKAMTAALKGEMYAVYGDCMVQLSSSWRQHLIACASTWRREGSLEGRPCALMWTCAWSKP